MKIENAKGIFDMDPESYINIERTNPLLSEQGSMSLPFSIKRTIRNDLLLNFPQKYERKFQYEIKQTVNLRAGILNENATLELLSVNKDTVESVFYLYESSFYNQIKEIKLTQVFEGIERWFQPETVSQEERVGHILDMFETMIFSEPDYSQDFTVFPVAVNCELRPKLDKIFQANAGANSKYWEMINQVYYSVMYNENRLQAKYPYQYTDDDGNEISIPAGYGASPFLRFGYILRKIFEYFGLTIEPTIFETNPSYQKWCVINNTMDAIMPGYFIESQLVPDCTVNDFLEIVRSLCGDFFIDVPAKTAKLVFFNDVLDAEPDMDLTGYLTSGFSKIELSKPKQVRLTVDRSTPLADVATPTFEEFKKKYSEYNPLPHTFDSPQGIYPYYEQNSIWKWSEPKAELLWNSYKTDWLSSMNFDYDSAGELEREEHKFAGGALGASLVKAGSDIIGHIMPVIGSMRNLNSNVIVDGTTITEDTPKCPIMLRIEEFLMDSKASDPAFNRTGLHSNASGFLIPGTVLPPDYPYSSLLLWDEKGLYNTFWKRYDQLLRTSFHSITYHARIPTYILQKFRFDRLKIINGQPLITESLKYRMSDEHMVDVEMKFRTVKVYE
ncbi:hypothetical protein IR083_10150 [Dysgonomonas sp. GY75]|uniref:hypothetical protein n=1 Tax=Dysgonomonas sp. GY75 TaxID=2780419 RepID=UPI001883F46F|nr:hypothetical protein [Dysgonomonas sp. GY75]MBF0649182.1 hypothetical protein [Dysgonomonas sp. GY75]